LDVEKNNSLKWLQVYKEDSLMTEKVSEKKVIGRNVAIALGIICIILAVGLVGAINDRNNTITSDDSQISNLQNQITSLTSQIQHMQYLDTSIYSSGLNGSGIILSTSSNYINGVWQVTIRNPTALTLINCQVTILSGVQNMTSYFGAYSGFSLAAHSSVSYSYSSYFYYYSPLTIFAYGYLPK
jgi:hypothetical protein